MAVTPSQKLPATAWGAMIICGTVAGAGMFTLPVVMAGAWFSWSVGLLIVSWLCMLLSGLLFMKTSLYYPMGSGYDTLTQDLTSPAWSILNGLSITFVLGILTYAYISASGPVYQHSLSQAGLPITIGGAKILLTLFIGAVIWLGTKGVSRLITLCLVAKILLFLALFGGLLTQVDSDLLFHPQGDNHQYWPYLLAIVPFCLASFGFHGNITGLLSYYRGDSKRVSRALIWGTLFALLIYLFWITCTMGNINRHDFPAIVEQGGDIQALIQTLHHRIHVKSLTLLLDIFSHFAVICSFLGVTVGLFDFIADKLQFADTQFGRFKTALVTFFPPLFASLLYPQGFLLAISYAGLFATLWALFTPALLSYRAHQRFHPQQAMPIKQKLTIGLVVLFGIVNVVAWLLSQWHVLPEFKG